MARRTFIVTGASSGIGRETARVLSRLGARIVLVARDQGRLEEAREALEDGDHLTEIFDLHDVTSLPNWMKHLSGLVGPLHGIAHCAGLQFTVPVRFLKDTDVDDLLRINVTSALMLARGFCQKGVSAEGGSLVFLSSVMALVGQPGQALYSASKGALVSLTKSLALEFARNRIRVNCIAAGMVRSPMTDGMMSRLTSDQVTAIETMHPLGLGTTTDVAEAAAFLLGDSSRWITGTTLTVDGGYTAH